MDPLKEYLRDLAGREEAWKKFREKACDLQEMMTTYCKDYDSERCPGTCDYAQKRKDMCA